MPAARPLSARRAVTFLALVTSLLATVLSVGVGASSASQVQTGSRLAATSGQGPGRGADVALRLAPRFGLPAHPLASRTSARAPRRKGQPLFRHTEFPDPTGYSFRGRYVAVATGPMAPRSTATSVRGPWKDRGGALKRLPRWATGRSIWASDLVQVKRNRWLLYFAAPAGGLGPLGRCIGVATSRSPFTKFHPRKRPLVCPRWARTPDASDPVRPPSPSPDRAGVIDPEGFQARNGSRYLLYRTQGTPSSIRMVRLTRDGLRARKDSRTRILATSPGVIENPVLVQQRKAWVLITSQGYYGDCDYRTTWRRARSLKSLKGTRSRALVTRASSRLCGPGGADLVDGDKLFLHAWSCRDRGCPHSDLQRSPRYGAQRSLYVARLRWDRRGRPHLGAFLRPASNRQGGGPGGNATAGGPGPLLPLPLR